MAASVPAAAFFAVSVPGNAILATSVPGKNFCPCKGTFWSFLSVGRQILAASVPAKAHFDHFCPWKCGLFLVTPGKKRRCAHEGRLLKFVETSQGRFGPDPGL